MEKNDKKSLVYKVKNKLTRDIFYTSKDWSKKTIDGVEFIPVKKYPSDTTVHYMKRDYMEKSL